MGLACRRGWQLIGAKQTLNSMSKIRVYELAKELGLDNKALLSLCERLGIEGKASHSNSLTDDESDRIRRWVIRSALDGGGAAASASGGGSSGDFSTGAKVIRRRKRAQEESPSAPSASGGDAGGISLSASPGMEPRVHTRQEALKQADELFSASPPVQEVETEITAEELSADSDVCVSPPSEPEVLESEPVELSGRESELGSVAVAPQEDLSPPPVDDAAESTEELDEPSAPSGLEPAGDFQQDEVPTPPEQEGEVVSAESVVEKEAFAVQDPTTEGAGELDEVRRRHDIRAPKVLGKIELPLPAKKGKPASKDSAAKDGGRVVAQGEGAPRDLPSSEDGWAGKAKGKGKKGVGDKGGKGAKRKRKQVLLKDELLDYDRERDVWKSKKARRQKGARRGGGGGDDRAAVALSTHASKTVVKMAGEISVGEFAKSMGIKVPKVMQKLMSLGVMATVNQLIDFDTASLVAGEFGLSVVNTTQEEEGYLSRLCEEDAEGDLAIRPPVVTVMGHVDHGKTSLLDSIRESSVAKREAGGITQHIGAYSVFLESGGSVTFLDTPGHEAFTSMRSRGAKVTDIVVLVVAADDGVMPQTIEAINHAKAAGVPIIVALNKIDKESAQPERVINQLAEYDLIPEDWGGDTIIVPLSAHTGEGIGLLLENLHLQAELMELKANANRSALGTVVESRLDKGRGPVMTILVQNGTLRKGDIFLAGCVFGRVRALLDDTATTVEEAGPSIPVEIVGVSGTALAGDDFYVLEDESLARRLAEQRAMKLRSQSLLPDATIKGGVSLESFAQMVSAGEMKELPLVVKADVQGSVEAVADSLKRLSNEEVEVKIIHRGVGAISENDIQLASASKAVVIGFNVRADLRASRLAQSEGVELLYSRVIYEIVESIEAALKGMMAPKFEEKTLGKVEVRQTFRVPKLGTVAGSYVVDGVVQRGAKVRLLRDSRVVFEGNMATLRRYKEDVKEVASGYECGIGIEGYSDIRDGDFIEIYTVEQIPT